MNETMSFLMLTVLGLVFWLLLSGYDMQIFVFGLAVSLITAGIVLKIVYTGKPHKFKFIEFLKFIPLYFIELLKAIVYMIYFIFLKRIQPNIKGIKLGTNSDTIKDCIAFSITNLPGSVAIDSGNKSLVSHSIVFDQNYVNGVKKFESHFLRMMGVKR